MFTFIVQELASSLARESILYDILRKNNLLSDDDVKKLAAVVPPEISVELEVPDPDLFDPFFQRFKVVTGKSTKNSSDDDNERK
jgi:hypothetical protein